MDDAARRPLGYALVLPAAPSNVELLVHESVRQPFGQNLTHALADTPTTQSLDGQVITMTGAMAVGSAIAMRLSTALAMDKRLTLLIPHGFAIRSEIESLQDDFDGQVAGYKDSVYIKFERGHATPETIRRALASMIGSYSVAWLFDDTPALVRPCLAIVPIFDGDGFALLTQSRESLNELLPGVPEH